MRARDNRQRKVLKNTSAELDLSGLTDWQVNWINRNLHPLQSHAEITLERDCYITGGVWDCRDDIIFGIFGVFDSGYGNQSGEVTLVWEGTFADSIIGYRFDTDSARQASGLCQVVDA